MKNSTCLVTGSLGLIGYETTLALLRSGHRVIGIDNNLRSHLFGVATQYQSKLEALHRDFPDTYRHQDTDIRDQERMGVLFAAEGKRLASVVHTAAQTSHDWAKKDPDLDFTVNAYATLHLLRLFHTHAPRATFIFTSTNKVYGDRVNFLPLREAGNRFDLSEDNPHFQGIDETFSIDQSTHSLFGVSKTAADLLVQEYGRYFGLATGVFRLGVITGEGQSDSIFQGFLTYVIRQAMATGRMTYIGYDGLQVRDILHAADLAKAFLLYLKAPKSGEVYNMGGGRENALSLREIRSLLEEKLERRLKIDNVAAPRTGDHKWWITDTRKFRRDYGWKPELPVEKTIDAIIRYGNNGKD